MSDAKGDGDVVLRLTYAEALVLFEWLARSDAAGSIQVEDPAEERVLWRLEGQLESKINELLAPNYKEAVEAARLMVRGSQE